MDERDVPRIHIGLASQRLTLFQGDEELARYPVSTARNGAGEKMASECTPRGYHTIRALIGDSLPPGSVLVGRRPSGEIWSEELAARYPDRDWILSRILWLSGREVGRNRLGQVDSMRRYIYIHGTPDCEPVGVPASHGCIRMRNEGVIDLFSRVRAGTPVNIEEHV
jgi:lipoprotein-anchoring transpeptidase ErfK/SrfK